MYTRYLIIFTLTISLCLVHGCKSRTFDSDLRDAESNMGIGYTDDALEAYISIARKYPGESRRPVILLRIAKLFEASKGDIPTAIKAYGRVIDQYPITESSRVAREERARLEQKRGNLDAAIEDINALIKLFPDYPDRLRYTIILGSIYMADRKYLQVRAELAPLLEDKSAPSNILEEALFIYAESFFLEGRPEDAGRWYKTFLRNFPDSNLGDEARLHLATCLEEMGRLGAARVVTRSASSYPNRRVIDARLSSIDERGARPPKESTGEIPKSTPVGD